MSNVLEFQVNGSSPSSVGGTGTGVKYFPRLLGPSIGVAPSTPSSTSAAGVLMLPAQNVYNGQQFRVLAAGTFTDGSGDPSGVIDVKLYAVTNTFASPTYTAIAGIAQTTPLVPGSHSWAIEAGLSGDTLSGRLGGYQIASVDGVMRTGDPITSTAVISGLDFNAGNVLLQQGAVLGFVVGVTFGTSDANNAAKLYEFTIES